MHAYVAVFCRKQCVPGLVVDLWAKCHMNVCAHIWKSACMYMHTYIHTYICTYHYISTHLQTYMLTQVHACVHEHLHPYTHTYVRTYMLKCFEPPGLILIWPLARTTFAGVPEHLIEHGSPATRLHLFVRVC